VVVGAEDVLVVLGGEVEVEVVDGGRRPCPTAVVFVVLAASVVVVVAMVVGADVVAVAAAVVGRPVVEVVLPREVLTVVEGEVRRTRGVGGTVSEVTEVGAETGAVVDVVVAGMVVASVAGTSVVAVGEVWTGVALSVVVLTLSEFFGGPPLVAAKTMARAAAAATSPQANPLL
jgi:hypothetical protein